MPQTHQRIPKKTLDEIDINLATIEPEMNNLDWEEFGEAVRLFNSQQFWESHEQWERVWLRHPEESRFFFQGLVQLAAAYHQLGRGIWNGVLRNFQKSYPKLKLFQPRFLGVEVTPLVIAIESGLDEIKKLQKGYVLEFDKSLISIIQWKRP